MLYWFIPWDNCLRQEGFFGIAFLCKALPCCGRFLPIVCGIQLIFGLGRVKMWRFSLLGILAKSGLIVLSFIFDSLLVHFGRSLEKCQPLRKISQTLIHIFIFIVIVGFKTIFLHFMYFCDRCIYLKLKNMLIRPKNSNVCSWRKKFALLINLEFTSIQPKEFVS